MIGNPEEISRYLWQLDKDKKYELKEYKEKRSLNANSYCWALITELANVLRLSKEEVYLMKLKDYGQSMLIPVLKGEEPDGYFKYHEYETSSILNGKEADWYRVFKGSSEYNTREMSIFIDGIIQDCKEQGIETRPKEEIQSLLERWNNI
ncbi:MAG: hypothetical protein IJ272_08255 [Clostridia bacterium]|nr:hypothetical protein [Clostridia bacterium]